MSDQSPDADRQDQLRSRLRGLGFDEVRFVRVPDLVTTPTHGLAAWLQAGMHADMEWMERTRDKRSDPRLVLSGTRSMILLGVDYWTGTPPGQANGPRWARYALYEDYHDTIRPALVAAGRVLEELYGAADADYRYYVDTGPVIERGWAARAGLGFIGKNAMLISRQFGNWLFLAAILTRLEFAPDPPLRRARTMRVRKPADAGGSKPVAAPDAGLLCGKCTRCLTACPTGAFPAPGVVDARRCISYQTIENKGVIPRELRAALGMRIYGCDVCLEVCPWNRFAREGRRLLLAARSDLVRLTLEEVLDLTPERFAAVFRCTPIKRLKLTRLLRNACIVAGNSGNSSLLPRLVRLAVAHPLPLVRAHAVWAVFRLGGGAALAAAGETEPDPIVRAEYVTEFARSTHSA